MMSGPASYRSVARRMESETFMTDDNTASLSGQILALTLIVRAIIEKHPKADDALEFGGRGVGSRRNPELRFTSAAGKSAGSPRFSARSP
jgi:hypothetical protein